MILTTIRIEAIIGPFRQNGGMTARSRVVVAGLFFVCGSVVDKVDPAAEKVGFTRDIMPLLTKMNGNTAKCHGALEEKTAFALGHFSCSQRLFSPLRPLVRLRPLLRLTSTRAAPLAFSIRAKRKSATIGMPSLSNRMFSGVMSR